MYIWGLCIILVAVLSPCYAASKLLKACLGKCFGTEPSAVADLELSPVIVAPGLFAAYLYADILDDTSSAPECAKFRGERISIWPDLWEAAVSSDRRHCIEQLLKLSYDPVTRKVGYNKAANIIVDGFDKVERLEYFFKTDYLHTLISNLERWGYVRNFNLRAAYFDFRLNFDDPIFQQRYKELIEKTFAETGGLPVTLFCYSQSCLNTLYFLQQQSDDWKTKFVKQYFVHGGPFGGAQQAASGLIAGENLGVINMKPIKIATDTARHWMGLFNLIPNGKCWGEEPIVISEQGNFTVNEYESLFNILSPEATAFYRVYAQSKWDPYKPPGVETYCFWGTGLSTGGAQKFGKLVYTGMPHVWPYNPIHEDGDTVVTTRSSSICKYWKDHPDQKFPVHLQNFPGVNHGHLLKNKNIIEQWRKALVSN